ncbi:MAG: hypothetical protein Q8755_03085, partial [Candidatus Phytoplasma australasiaticum]|nr:hypothetical protein [Candidatus Phytoplasma australasiaticum]
RSILVQRAEDAAENFSELFTEDGSSSPMLYALMAHVEGQVNDTEPSTSECHSCTELAAKIESLKNHNQMLVDDLTKCTKVNRVLVDNERDYKETIKTLKDNVSNLSKTVILKQDAINSYITSLEQTKKELATVKCDYEASKLKFDSYSNSKYVLDHIIEVGKPTKKTKGLGYGNCPPPLGDKFLKEDVPRLKYFKNQFSR